MGIKLVDPTTVVEGLPECPNFRKVVEMVVQASGKDGHIYREFATSQFVRFVDDFTRLAEAEKIVVAAALATLDTFIEAVVSQPYTYSLLRDSTANRVVASLMTAMAILEKCSAQSARTFSHLGTIIEHAFRQLDSLQDNYPERFRRA